MMRGTRDVRVWTLLLTLAQGCAPAASSAPGDGGDTDIDPSSRADSPGDGPMTSVDVAVPQDQAMAIDGATHTDAANSIDVATGVDLTVAEDRAVPIDAPTPRDVTDGGTLPDRPSPTDIIDVGPRADVSVVDARLPADAPGVSDAGAAGAWELIGDFGNGLWQFGNYLTIAGDGTLYLARAYTGVYRGVLREGRYVFDLLPNTGLTNLSLSAVGVNARGDVLVGCFGTSYGGTGPGMLFRFSAATSRWTAATIPSPGYTRNVSDFYLAPDGSVFATGGWSALVLRSTDGGDTFAIRANLDTARPGLRAGLLFSLEVGPGNEMFVGTEIESFQHSFDDGRTFTPIDNATWLQRSNPYGVGFTRTGTALFSRAVDADPTKIYHRDPERGWVRADSGLARDPVNTAGIPNWLTSIVLAPWGDNFIATTTTAYRARDGGAWSPFATGIDPRYTPSPNAIVTDGRCVYMAVRPVAPRTDIGAIYRYCGG